MSVSAAEHAPGHLARRAPLSLQQEFLCLFDKGDDSGPFGPRYHIVGGWRLRGPVDADRLQGALDDLVERHESLRTSIVRDAGDRHQLVVPPSSPRLVVTELPAGDPAARDAHAEEFLNEVEAGPVSVRELPLVKAFLGRFDDQDSVLVLAIHHTAADGWSMQVLARDLAHSYAVRTGHDRPPLPPVTQYREYAEAQRAGLTSAAAAASRQYWRDKLGGAQILALPTDRLRSAEPNFSTGWHRFSLGNEVSSTTAKVAASMRSTPFMVLVGAFELYLHAMTGVTDLVVPTFTPGRRQAKIHDTVGSFFNFVPLRTDIAGCRTFREVVERTKATCLEAYAHEMTLAEILQVAPELMVPAATDGLAACVFQVIQWPFKLDRVRVGEVEYTAMHRRLLSQPVGSDIPDGSLWWLEFDPSGDLFGSIGYSSNLLDYDTVTGWLDDYRQVLCDAIASPDAPLAL